MIQRFFVFLLMAIPAFQAHAQYNLEEDSINVKVSPERLDKPIKSEFLDLFMVDTLRKALQSPFLIKYPTKIVAAPKEPFDPLKNELYAQRSTSRFWYFAALLFGLTALFFYIQNFPSQFSLRIQSILNPLKFRELLNEKKSRVVNGTFYVLLVNCVFWSLIYIVVLLRLRFFELNNTAFFTLMLVTLFLIKFVVYTIQVVQAKVLSLENEQFYLTQRHVNVDLIFGLILLPIAIFFYFNPQFLFATNEIVILISVAIPLLIRVLIELIGIIREGGISFQILLYFCAFEIIPIAILVIGLIKSIYATG
jgi:hypothetical protein